MSKILNIGIKVQEKIVKPSTERQVITADSGYTCLDKVIVEGVTSAIDSNIKPENIKKDVEILGVTGIMESASVPTKSWLYITEYDRNGYPIKAKTIGCSGNMPYDYMYGHYDSSNKNILQTLQEFEINEGVTSIGENAFSGCRKLTSITIPDSVTSIGNSTFYECSSLTSITIPESVTSIGSYAFQSCSNLTNITIPNGVTSIGSYAFRYCRSLTSITIPNSVIRILDSTFYECTNLTSITIGDSVTSIGREAFRDCSSLTSITLPSALTKIDSYAFYSCSKLSLFDFRKVTQVPTLSNTSAFYSTPSTKKIVVPDSLYDTWITSTNWSSSDNGIVSSIIKASDYEASL